MHHIRLQHGQTWELSMQRNERMRHWDTEGIVVWLASPRAFGQKKGAQALLTWPERASGLQHVAELEDDSAVSWQSAMPVGLMRYAWELRRSL